MVIWLYESKYDSKYSTITCNLIPGCEMAACISTPVTTRETIYACTTIIKIPFHCYSNVNRLLIDMDEAF